MDGNEEHPTAPLRVEEDPTFAVQGRKLAASVPRFDEILEGIKWAVARAPEKFPLATEGSSVRIVKSPPFGGPALRVFFKVNDDHVLLLTLDLLE